MNKLKEIIIEKGLDVKSTGPLLEGFGKFFTDAQKLAGKAKLIKVKNIDDLDSMEKASDLRKELKAIRVDSNKMRKEKKEVFLRTGQVIQQCYNDIEKIIKPAEDYLVTQEKFAELQEEKRLEKINSKRIELLSNLVDDVSLFDLKSMDEETFDKLLKDSKISFELKEKQAKEDEEKRKNDEKKNKIHADRLQKLMPYGQFLDLSNFNSDSDDNKFNKLLLEGREKKIKFEQEQAEKAEKQREIVEKQKKELEKIRKQKELEEKEAEKLAKKEAEEKKRMLEGSEKEKFLKYVSNLKQAFVDIEMPIFKNKEYSDLFNNFQNYQVKVFNRIEIAIKTLDKS